MAVTVLRWLPVALLALLGSAPATLRAEDAAKPEGCQTPSEMPGQCIALKACEPLARLTLPNHSPNAADKQLLRDSVCGEIYQEKVCCPTTKEGTIPATAASATDSPAGEDESDSDEGSGVGERIGGDDGEPDAVGERRFRLPGRGRRPNLIVGSNQPGRQWGQPVGSAFDLLNNLFTSTSPSMPSLGGGFNDNPFHNNPYNNPFMNSNPFNSPFNNPYENNPYNPFNSDYTTTRRPFGGSSFGNDFTTTRRPFGGSSFGEDFTTRRPFAGGSFGNDFTTRRPFGGSSFGNDFTTTRRPFGGSSFGNDFTTTRRPFGGSSLGTDFSGSRPSNPRPNRPMKNSGGPLINPPECGPLNSDDKIVGGNMTAIMELPWMARLGYESRGGRGVSYRCGGSLINSRYVLTAAHCTGGKDNPVQVRLGEHDAESQEDCSYMAGEKICAPPVVDVDVEQVIRHPEYSDDASSSDYLQNDIALLRLRTPVKFTQAVKPICLPETSTRQNLEGKKAVVSGWGKDRNRGSSGTRFLMKASVPLINNRECARIFRERRISINENSQVCAGGKRGVDSCQGDSGGPLYRPDAMNDGLRVVQMGVVSFGLQNCATEGVPGVYTRVQHFMPWIRSNMRP